uniref:Uncharacterized protein n=1 Tax=Rhizophora mucronata TaxID=61149 RepID=A0A2P2NA13_RHIMU
MMEMKSKQHRRLNQNMHKCQSLVGKLMFIYNEVEP